ncbi:hypothetical protein KJ359_012071 [Pestalotiopsis sp. 9143b]|nr:hypothetical protein KJ359_012071 [Pestalotiopsis sp. 9143b]
MARAAASEDLSALVQELAQLTAADYSPEAGFSSPEAKQTFTDIVENLGARARDPAENIYYLATRTAQSSAIRCAIQLGIFGVLAGSVCPMSADEIAKSTGADTVLVERLMRTLVGCGIFSQADTRSYKPNRLARAFSDQHNRDMFQQLYDFIGKGAYVLHEFLESTGWKNPESYEKSAINLGLGISQAGFWEWLSADATRQALFNSAMQSQPSAVNVAAVYDFERELNRETIGPDDVAVVDVGGARGHALVAIRQAFPGLKGRLVLQEQTAVLEEAIAQGLPGYIEPQAASFFETNPARNARAYYFRRIFHDWSDPMAVRILSNTVAAMGPKSRVLIADIMMPQTKAPWYMAVQDLNMMVIGGIERTEEQWRSLLTKANLSLTKIWKSQGSHHVIIEAHLSV